MATPVQCSACGSANEAGRKFCGECGASLLQACPACAAANGPGVKFCGECGALLGAPSTKAAAGPTAVAERRLVSVLFADLVGFTTLSESRDAEEVRELLSGYFETARQVIERYGGTVEKFIGDAVMAVWGTPTATEDDAERAVRAGLDLVAAVAALGETAGAPDLRARAGVLTGEAAVTLGASGEGMVAGDLVNTASRIQSAAQPGQVFVGETTRRATEAAVVYEDAGSHELKGKAGPVDLARAVRVMAARRGGGRSGALEAPFVGREREFRVLKELFHASATDRRASLVTVVGVAGIGKSRLAWEFEKYLDGLIADIYWHRGRCLSYGEGVAFWALAEMVRMRAGIAEDEPEDTAVEKLRQTLATHLPDPEERAWVEPHLQQLLCLGSRAERTREDLFSAWRLFFERLAESATVVLVFEDVHWADAGLMEFIEHLLEWSRRHAIYVIALARPELAERHPSFARNARSATTTALDPLDDEAMDELMRGLVPGLSNELCATICERADGIPLYAIETVRMLLDRGLLVRDGDAFVAHGEITSLEVPETLHALVAARLDGLTPTERAALQAAAVLGKTFTSSGLAAVAGLGPEELQDALDALVRKEVLVLDDDRRSPERGHYGFLQALVQRVAYGTLSRRERKARHLAAATMLAGSAGIDSEQIAEVIATHYRDAYEAEPNDDDAQDLRARACDWLCRGGERSASLGATDDARRAFVDASSLTEDPVERARLLELAGDASYAANTIDVAEADFRSSHHLLDQAGRTHDAARVMAKLSVTVWAQGRGGEALAMLEPALTVLLEDEPDESVALLAAEAARIHHFERDVEKAFERIELALQIAEDQALPRVLTEALNTKALLLKSRPHESRALMREALTIALDHDIVHSALRAYNNMIVIESDADRPLEAAKYGREGYELAIARGHTQFALGFGLAGLVSELLEQGRYDDAFELAEQMPLPPQLVVASHVIGALLLARAAVEQGDDQRARRWLDIVSGDIDTSTDRQHQALSTYKRLIEALLAGDTEGALAMIEPAARQMLEDGWVDAISANTSEAAMLAVDLGDPALALPVAAVLEEVPSARRGRRGEVALQRVRGNAAAAAGDDNAAAEAFALALATARNLNEANALGPALLDYGRWLVGQERGEEAQPLLDEAREIFERMGARTWLTRLDVLDGASHTERSDEPAGASAV
jgi:class 3 adenylate cyclase/predicted ATPase